MTEAEDKMAALLAELWLRNRPIVEERLVTLEQAAAAAAAGTLGEELRLEGVATAHKLAGALGMYGFDEGTRIARELEVALGSARTDAAQLDESTAAQLGERVAALRRTIFPEG